MEGSLFLILIYLIPIAIFLRFLVVGMRYMQSRLELEIIRVEQMDKFIAIYKKVNHIHDNENKPNVDKEEGWRV